MQNVSRVVEAYADLAEVAGAIPAYNAKAAAHRQMVPGVVLAPLEAKAKRLSELTGFVPCEDEILGYLADRDLERRARAKRLADSRRH